MEHAVHHIHVKTIKGNIYKISHSKETIELKELMKQINTILTKDKK